ncbi:MAG: CPBP family intramembrane glutamic endopeptidase, partial [Candidatus Zixiibacteriota bacterium]
MEQTPSPGQEKDYNLNEISKPEKNRHGRIGTIFLLFFLLVIWPLSSYLLMSESGQESGLSAAGENELKVTTQIYIPTILIQLLVFLLIFLIILREKENLSSIGLKGFNFSNLMIGVIFWLVISSFFIALSLILQLNKLVIPPEVTYLLPRTQTQKILWVIMASSVSITEESAFRGFILTRLNFYLKSWWLTILITSLSFSLGHLYQGLVGMLFAGIYGVAFSLLFLWRKSLTPCITAHFLQDIT